MPPESQELIHSADPARKTDGRLLATSFYYRLLNIMSKFAAISGNEADIPAYQELAANIKSAYNQMFLNAETGQYANNTVTANILSLMQDLTPDSLQGKVFENIVEKTQGEFDSHVSTGLIGIQFLMRGLTEYGNGRPGLHDRYEPYLSELGLYDRQGRHDDLGIVERRYGRSGDELGQPRDVAGAT